MNLYRLEDWGALSAGQPGACTWEIRFVGAARCVLQAGRSSYNALLAHLGIASAVVCPVKNKREVGVSFQEKKEEAKYVGI